MKAGVGCSAKSDAHQAAKEAVSLAVSLSGDPALTILFTTEQYDQKQILSAVQAAAGRSKIVGFCTGGIITADGVLPQGVGVCTISGPELKVTTALQSGLAQDPMGIGRAAGEALLSDGAESGTVIVLPDGLTANVPEMLRGLYNAMGPDFNYIGGGGGDNLQFVKTYQFTEEGVASDALAVALIQGLHINTGIGHGWKPMGDPLVITDACGKRVCEIDGEAAFSAYSKRLGTIPQDEFPEVGMRHPFGFPDISGNYLIRDPISVGEDECIDFVTEIPNNAVGSLMVGEFDELISTAQAAVHDTVEKTGTPGFVLMFDCISRYMLMGDRFGEEFRLLRQEIGPDVPVLGTLTFGEIGSYEDVPLFHNKTLAVAVGRA